MLPLAGNDFPKSRDELQRAIDDGLKLYGAPKGVVGIEGSFPILDSLRIDLSGARIDTNTQRPSRDLREKQPGVETGRLEVSATPFLLCDAPVQFRLTADAARFDFARGADGRPVLVLNAARSGEIDAQIRRADLQTLVRALAHAAAAKHGATIEDVDLSLTTLGPRALGFEAKITASMFMKTTVQVTGWLEIDDALNAHFSKLTCEAGGMVGSMAAGFIRPQLVKLQSQPIPLANLPLGGVKLRDVKIDAGEPLRVQAWFGADADS